jgi:TorA maturation chaperone TorD
MLVALQAIAASDGQMKAAWAVLQQAASQAVVDDLADEYQELFVGIGRGELLPYGSWYLTGFLMEKPLAELRTDLGRLGFERQAETREPEDHAAALCETMSLIIASGAAISYAQQRDFFRKHLAPWMGRFFADMAAAKSARFYRAVGILGEQFLEIERNYLDMPV